MSLVIPPCIYTLYTSVIQVYMFIQTFNKHCNHTSYNACTLNEGHCSLSLHLQVGLSINLTNITVIYTTPRVIMWWYIFLSLFACMRFLCHRPYTYFLIRQGNTITRYYVIVQPPV
ncbi:membrane protein [Candidatus Magnetobacterium bavaricum]|uniref:Membrane protein n=1 Tax=Candidatus Magnetobacterium bavaricum TaxID=29290 RepID=A0A0F3GLE1_9BACT|nr:membrane protein [Candidatus Magnetobacterium bavaricum]